MVTCIQINCIYRNNQLKIVTFGCLERAMRAGMYMLVWNAIFDMLSRRASPFASLWSIVRSRTHDEDVFARASRRQDRHPYYLERLDLVKMISLLNSRYSTRPFSAQLVLDVTAYLPWLIPKTRPWSLSSSLMKLRCTPSSQPGKGLHQGGSLLLIARSALLTRQTNTLINSRRANFHPTILLEVNFHPTIQSSIPRR